MLMIKNLYWILDNNDEGDVERDIDIIDGIITITFVERNKNNEK